MVGFVGVLLHEIPILTSKKSEKQKTGKNGKCWETLVAHVSFTLEKNTAPVVSIIDRLGAEGRTKHSARSGRTPCDWARTALLCFAVNGARRWGFPPHPPSRFFAVPYR